MKIDVDCYAVIGSELQLGIPAVWQNPNGGIERPLGDNGDTDVRQTTMSWPANNLPAKRGGVVIAVYPPRLKLPGEPVSPGLNFWPGGECLVRNGRWSKNCTGIPRAKWPYNRYEIFLLFEGEKLVLCDHGMRIAVVNIKKGEPALRTPSPQEMVDYIYEAGMRTGTHRGLLWAIHNIEAIVSAHPRVKAGDALRKLRAKLPSGPVNVRA
jgi:hypothetical protein